MLISPVAGVAVSHASPEEVVTVADQSSLCIQAPLVLIVASCAARVDAPTTPAKLRVVGATEMAQAACSVKLTGICCGLPSAALPTLSEPVIVIAPL